MQTGEHESVPLAYRHLGRGMYSSRPITLPETIKYHRPGSTVWGACFGLQEYMMMPLRDVRIPNVPGIPGTFHAILTASYRCSLAMSFWFKNKADGTRLLPANRTGWYLLRTRPTRKFAG